MIRRILAIASTACLLASIALVAMWIRSYHHADRLQAGLWGERAFIVASKQGRVAVVTARLPAAADWWQSGIHTFPFDDEMSFPVGSVRLFESGLGFGIVRQPYYMVTRSSFETPPGGTVFLSGAAAATLNGSGVLLPCWFLLSLAALAGGLLCGLRPWRFTVRSLLIAVTLLAILMGLIVGLDNAPSRAQFDDPVPLDDL